ncbi:hypothetical protein NUSPORA_00436 [Nucleospora cyclopteri]
MNHNILMNIWFSFKCILTSPVDLIFIYEKLEPDKGLSLYVENLLDIFNKSIMKNTGITFRLKELLFYNDYKFKMKNLSLCTGTKDISCRLRNITVDDNVFMFISSFKHIDRSEFDKYTSINLCRTRYFTNIYELDNLYKTTFKSIEDWTSNIVGYDVSKYNNIQKQNKNLRDDLNKCNLIYEMNIKTRVNHYEADKENYDYNKFNFEPEKNNIHHNVNKTERWFKFLPNEDLKSNIISKDMTSVEEHKLESQFANPRSIKKSNKFKLFQSESNEMESKLIRESPLANLYGRRMQSNISKEENSSTARNFNKRMMKENEYRKIRTIDSSVERFPHVGESNN